MAKHGIFSIPAGHQTLDNQCSFQILDYSQAIRLLCHLIHFSSFWPLPGHHRAIPTTRRIVLLVLFVILHGTSSTGSLLYVALHTRALGTY
jgi:hypothetical protein